jgi:HEAT repeat protein
MESAALSEAVPALAKVARSPDVQLRREVFRTLEALGTAARPAVSALVERLRNGTNEDRIRAAIVLRKIGAGGKEAVSALIVLLEHQSTRLTAAQALGAIGPQARDAVPVLRAALTDADRMVREAAAQALEMIEPGASTQGPPDRLREYFLNAWCCGGM